MKSILSMLAGAAALAVGLAAAPALADDEGIVVYNAQHESLAKEWAEGFTKETGIQVTLRNGGDSEFSNQIVAEGAASPADVFLTENSPAMVLVENAGLFAPVDADTLALVPEQFRPSSGKWIGIAARSTVFAYNKEKLSADQLPKSLLDLADPSWKGRWAASPSGADFQAIVSALLELKGEEATAAWLKAMKENFTAYKGNGTVMKAVNAGEIDGGVIYHYYWFGDQAKTGENSKNVELHYFKNEDPGAFVSISHEVAPEFREYERLSTTVVNAYLGPIMKSYLSKLQPRLAEIGIEAHPHLTQSNGGVISSEVAQNFPARTVLSGPAAGVIGALSVGGLAGFDNVITFDMGGTSTDVSLIDRGRPQMSNDAVVHGYPLKLPMLDIHTVGAGGGSIAHIDAGGLLKVGPRSAAADPGPVCYGRGNEEPTVTDANVVLQVLNPTHLLNGRMKIDQARGIESPALELS